MNIGKVVTGRILTTSGGLSSRGILECQVGWASSMQFKVALSSILDTALEPKKTVIISAKREVEFYSPVFNYANPEGSQ
jgi:hypothetical protein